MEELDQLKALVLHYLRGIWKNRWIAVIIAWPLMFAGIIAVDQIKNRYTAETKVYIDATSILQPLLAGLAIQPDYQSILQLMTNKLLSRPNLESAVRSMDLDIGLDAPKEMEKLIDEIRDRIDISAKGGGGKKGGFTGATYTIAYSDENAARAKRMVQTLLDVFVEDTLGTSATESDSAIAFIDQQIGKYEALLKEAEDRLANFKRENVGLMPGDGGGYYQRYQATITLLDQTQLLLDESINKRNEIKSQLDSLTQSIQAQDKAAISNIASSFDAQISTEETNLQNLLLLYTENHPDVINLKSVIETLKKRRQEEIEGMVVNSNVGKAPTSNPLYQNLVLLLTTEESNISAYKTRIASLKAEQQKLKDLVDIVPQIEAELGRLNRDYQIHQNNYNTFVARRETARISEDVESGTEQVKFRIIEPPFVGSEPAFPNRVLFDVGVLVLSLVIGYGIGFLISLFQPVFYSQQELAPLGGNILGTIPKFDTLDVLKKRRKNLLLFLLANLLFLVVGSTLIYMHSQGIFILSALQLKAMAL